MTFSTTQHPFRRDRRGATRLEVALGEVPVDAAGEQRGRGGKISADQARALCGEERMFAPIAARFVLVDTERWFWIRTVGAPRDGHPPDRELRPATREGATFAATQSRQNSLPSMSCITRHDSLSPSAATNPTPTAP